MPQFPDLEQVAGRQPLLLPVAPVGVEYSWVSFPSVCQQHAHDALTARTTRHAPIAQEIVQDVDDAIAWRCCKQRQQTVNEGWRWWWVW